MSVNRVLFVDDEPGQRLTLPAILRGHGFEVCTASSVAQALTEITTRRFDILISDLDIGEPGDGFTVVSAMRRTQPNCINFIVTGFPAFENALQAIQKQVDDVLVKPANVDTLIAMIEERLRERNSHHQPMSLMRLSSLLRGCADEIRLDFVAAMKADRALSAVALSDEARASHLCTLLGEIANQMDSAAPDTPTEQALALSREHGTSRFADGYHVGLLVAETRTLQDVIYDKVRHSLLLLDTSRLVLDLKRLNQNLSAQLQESIQAFCMEASKPRPRGVEFGLTDNRFQA
jgi:ActR/RegA family two-component response regulator